MAMKIHGHEILKFSFHQFIFAVADRLKMSRGRYITWTPEKLAAVQPHFYTLEEGPRLESARQALRDAGFAQDAEILTMARLNHAKKKLAEEQQAGIEISHKQAAKKKNREKQRQAEGQLDLRAQSERLLLKCHTWFFFLTVLSDVANIARVQQKLYPGVGMNGVLPGAAAASRPDVSEEAEEAGQITFSIDAGEDTVVMGHRG
jgi:hypothetical protein